MSEVETVFVGLGTPKEIPLSGPSEVLFILGQGVKPQLRHGSESPDRHVVIDSAYDSQILRVKTTAAAELIAHGDIDGPIVPTGARTASPDAIYAARKQWDITAAASVAQTDGASNNREKVMKVIEANPTFSYIEKQQLVGNPHTEAEMKAVSETSEAGLMESLLKKIVPKSHGVNEQSLPIWKEEEARNTVQNIIYLLNKLDAKNPMWDGVVKVLSSNDGHLDRGVAVLQAFGFSDDHIVAIAAEPVLETYKYGIVTKDEVGQNFLDRLIAEEVKDERLKGQGKWLEMIKRIPAYILPELIKLENNERLRSVIGALQDWYKESGVDMFAKYPKLAEYQTMDVGDLRAILKGINQDTKTEQVESLIDYDGMRQQIADNAKKTKEWIKGKK